MAGKTEAEEPALTAIGGEFADAAVEARFQADRLDETLRHGRVLMIAAVVLNALFLASDWRFAGTPHFWVALPARLAVIALAFLFLAILARPRRPATVQSLMAGWMMLNGAAIGALVSSHSTIALFVVVMLPTIYYLVVPTRYRLTLTAGIGTSAILLLGYGRQHDTHGTALGLALAMAILNSALAIAAARANRLDRRNWASAEAARGLHAELAASREAFERMFVASPVPLAIAREDGRILKLSDSCAALLGTDPAAVAAGDASLDSYYDRACPVGGALMEYEAPARIAGADHILLVRSTGLVLADGPVTLSGIIDITDRKRAERRLERLAATDGLTGLANRTSFFAGAETLLARARRQRQPVSLLMVDIDHFKAINDGFGHQAGDAVLCAFADLCGRTLTRSAMVARLGGEEFGILLPATALGPAAAIAERLRAAVEGLRVEIGGGEERIAITVSIGIATAHGEETVIDPALRRADLALYGAKRAGRNRVMADGEPIAADRRRA